MNLADVTKKLEEITAMYSQKIRELQKAELAYNLRFWHLVLHSGLGTITAKEAEANTVCNEEGLLEPVQVLRADIKALYYEKDCYIELSKNIRIMEDRYSYGGQEQQ